MWVLRVLVKGTRVGRVGGGSMDGCMEVAVFGCKPGAFFAHEHQTCHRDQVRTSIGHLKPVQQALTRSVHHHLTGGALCCELACKPATRSRQNSCCKMASQLQPLDQILAEISYAYDACFTVASDPIRGRSNTVYEIRSDRGHCWCLRVLLHADLARLVSRGTLVLKLVKQQRPSLQVPAVIRTSEQYMVMEYLEGRALQSWDTQLLTRERRKLMLDQLASFLFTLWTVDIPPTDVPTTPNMG